MLNLGHGPSDSFLRRWNNLYDCCPDHSFVYYSTYLLCSEKNNHDEKSH